MYIKTIEGQTATCLMTAKHVFQYNKLNWHPINLQLRFSDSDTLSFDKYLGIKLTLENSGRKLWYPHPDSTVDLACIPISGNSITSTDQVNIATIPYGAIAGINEIYDGSDIFVLGYPGFAGSEILVKSILRKGTISWTNPNNPLRNPFMIDCNIFPGNSGGPVFTLPTGMEYSGNIKDGGYIKFAGIVTKVYNDKEPAIDINGNDVYDNTNKKIYYLQRSALAEIEPASRVQELLYFVQNKIYLRLK
jgi:hypothetical protein